MKSAIYLTEPKVYPTLTLLRIYDFTALSEIITVTATNSHIREFIICFLFFIYRLYSLKVYSNVREGIALRVISALAPEI